MEAGIIAEASQIDKTDSQTAKLEQEKLEELIFLLEEGGLPEEAANLHAEMEMLSRYEKAEMDEAIIELFPDQRTNKQQKGNQGSATKSATYNVATTKEELEEMGIEDSIVQVAMRNLEELKSQLKYESSQLELKKELESMNLAPEVIAEVMGNVSSRIRVY